MLFKCLMGLFPCVGAVCLCCSNREEIVIWLLKTGCCPSSSTTLHLHPTLLPLSYCTLKLGFFKSDFEHSCLGSRSPHIHGTGSGLSSELHLHSTISTKVVLVGALQNAVHKTANISNWILIHWCIVSSCLQAADCGGQLGNISPAENLVKGVSKKKGDVHSNGHNFPKHPNCSHF